MKISKSTIDHFFILWNTSSHPGQRLGQAFYNFIQGHKIVSIENKEILDKLYKETSNLEARKTIDFLTDFSQ